MSDEVTSDPLYRSAGNTYTATFPVFGHTVTYRTNSAQLLDLIEQVYGRWRHLGPNHHSAVSFIIDVTLHDGVEGRDLPEFTYRLPVPERLLIQSKGSQAVVEVDNQRAYAYVTNDLLEHSEHCRWGMLDAMTLMLVTSQDRCPIHAAALIVGGRLVILAGGSGSGKSTLAYVLHSSGYDVVSDDTIYVQMTPEPRVWSAGERITLLPSVAQGFPELNGIVPKPLPTGKTKVIIPLGANVPIEPTLAPPVVCVLRRDEGVGAERRNATELCAMLNDGVEPGFDLLSEQRGPVLSWLCNGGGWQLNLSERPADAIAMIEGLIAR